jgi:hypothetical protein
MFLQRIGSGQRLKYPSSNGSQEATTESWRREWLEGYQMVMFLFIWLRKMVPLLS